MQSRNGAIAVAAVEYLADAAPVYNLEIAGEHVYEISDLALLVHNANWDCGKFLELQELVAENGIDSLCKASKTLYKELLDMVQNDFRTILGKEAVHKIKNAGPKDLVGHLHHILPKLGRGLDRQRIIELQKKMWELKLDPFMSLHIFVFAPNTGVHTDDAIEAVVKSLETFFETPRTRKGLIAKLRILGELARDGKLGK